LALAPQTSLNRTLNSCRHRRVTKHTGTSHISKILKSLGQSPRTQQIGSQLEQWTTSLVKYQQNSSLGDFARRIRRTFVGNSS
jgi:hypothetical protein